MVWHNVYAYIIFVGFFFLLLFFSRNLLRMNTNNVRLNKSRKELAVKELEDLLNAKLYQFIGAFICTCWVCCFSTRFTRNYAKLATKLQLNTTEVPFNIDQMVPQNHVSSPFKRGHWDFWENNPYHPQILIKITEQNHSTLGL